MPQSIEILALAIKNNSKRTKEKQITSLTVINDLIDDFQELYKEEIDTKPLEEEILLCL